MNRTRGFTIGWLAVTFLFLVVGSKDTLTVFDAVNTGTVPVAPAARAMQWVGYGSLAVLAVPVLVGSVAVYRAAVRLRHRTAGRS